MHELMFQAGVKGMSKRSELIPCIIEVQLQLNVVNSQRYPVVGVVLI